MLVWLSQYPKVLILSILLFRSSIYFIKMFVWLLQYSKVLILSIFLLKKYCNYTHFFLLEIKLTRTPEKHIAYICVCACVRVLTCMLPAMYEIRSYMECLKIKIMWKSWRQCVKQLIFHAFLRYFIQWQTTHWQSVKHSWRFPHVPFQSDLSLFQYFHWKKHDIVSDKESYHVDMQRRIHVEVSEVKANAAKTGFS